MSTWQRCELYTSNLSFILSASMLLKLISKKKIPRQYMSLFHKQQIFSQESIQIFYFSNLLQVLLYLVLLGDLLGQDHPSDEIMMCRNFSKLIMHQVSAHRHNGSFIFLASWSSLLGKLALPFTRQSQNPSLIVILLQKQKTKMIVLLANINLKIQVC